MTCGIARVSLLNDLEAMAYAVPVLNETELLTLQAGEPRLSGNMALIASRKLAKGISLFPKILSIHTRLSASRGRAAPR